MNNKHYFLFSGLKQIYKLLWPSLFAVINCSLGFYIMFLSDNFRSLGMFGLGGLIGIFLPKFFFLLQAFIITKRCYSYKYLYKGNRLFFIFYLLFFIFYFLSFFFYFSFHFISGLVVSVFHELTLAYQLFYFLFILIFLQKVFFVNNSYITRYGFAFLTAISDLILRYMLLTDSSIEYIFSSKFNTVYIESNLYLIPLTFAIIQLGVEMKKLESMGSDWTKK